MGRPPAPLVERECVSCGAPFMVKSYERKRFCGHSCGGRYAKSLAPDMRGSKNPRYNGGLSTMHDGRTVICCRDGSIMYYYRGVMAAHIGRLLRRDEIVHHVNGDRTDDRIENLEITTRAEHINHHRDDLLQAKLRRAKERKK